MVLLLLDKKSYKLLRNLYPDKILPFNSCASDSLALLTGLKYVSQFGEEPDAKGYLRPENIYVQIEPLGRAALEQRKRESRTRILTFYAAVVSTAMLVIKVIEWLSQSPVAP